MVFGIGLILLSLFIGFLSGMNDCSKLNNANLNLIENSNNLNMDAWVISCFNQNIMTSLVSTIIFTLGILFVIVGFLESKK
jgi:hypothetical protein